MVRFYMAFIGVGLLLLWIAFLSNPLSAWVHWVDFAAGITCLVTAGVVSSKTSRSVRTLIPAALALALLLVNVMEMQAHNNLGAQTWWNLGFSVLLVLAALAEASDFAGKRYFGTPGERPFYGMGYYGEIGNPLKKVDSPEDRESA